MVTSNFKLQRLKNVLINLDKFFLIMTVWSLPINFQDASLCRVVNLLFGRESADSKSGKSNFFLENLK